jgi:methylmalonyl-CoA mutase
MRQSQTTSDALSTSDTQAEVRIRHKVRLVTATSLFDGHDASINIFRRIAQGGGAEVIHLGHNRSASEIVDAAIEEDAQGIAITSYQGGHNEFFRYVHDLLTEARMGHIRIFGGGGGVILPEEIEALHAYGIERIYSPDDGRAMGLVGMVQDMLRRCDREAPSDFDPVQLAAGCPRDVARALSLAENDPAALTARLASMPSPKDRAPVLGVTGTGGAGKSSLIDELVQRFLRGCPERTVAVLSIDPTRRKTGGALLGDRIRMNAIHHPRAFMRSMATRRANHSLTEAARLALEVLRRANFDLIILESSGIGQSDTEITEHADVTLYVMTPEYGAATQLEKIDMLDFADLIAINKFDRRGALDALRDVRKQVQRNHNRFDAAPDTMPVFGAMASHFNDPGTNSLFAALMERLTQVSPRLQPTQLPPGGEPARAAIVPADRTRYLSEIAEANRRYAAWTAEQSAIAQQIFGLDQALIALADDPETRQRIERRRDALSQQLAPQCRESLADWDRLVDDYSGDEYAYEVRGRIVKAPLVTRSLSGTRLPKVLLPKTTAYGDRLRWLLSENVPGAFPFTAGVFPLKRTAEDPTRMFAGEGGPERTNRRFHYVAYEQPAKRLSTAFDSVTLYGEDPERRPDVFGKIGNAGVSICTVDDAKKLYSGFDLCDPTTSVSMTINGPAPMLLAFFFNAAIDQQCERWIVTNGRQAEVEAKVEAIYARLGVQRPRYGGSIPRGHDGLGLRLLGVSGDEVVPADVYAELRARALSTARGTVQADILKEDQAQNTCIFSTEFALRMMGDVQQFFVDHDVRNFYSVSISGYHIAEAGANPITQLAFTLANGFTYVEYYLARGMHIDDFAPNLSFFFSNGLDPEYAVIGRVARRIWAKAMKLRYGANDRSQKLKYHIQTSGRSLHAQEIAFNDIRTTLQALYAIYDNCQSLHTNAYDEAITTPTEESVRRAMAIQLIINRELGLARNENPLQGSFVIEELTDLVEEAVYVEFDRITERGGVLGAMETMYQRGKIQEESLHYESQKASGALPIVGVNTFLGTDGSPIQRPLDVMRSSDDEKEAQIEALAAFQLRNAARAKPALDRLQQVALDGGNVFAALLDAAKCCSLGQMSAALYEVGGRYRRNM